MKRLRAARGASLLVLGVVAACLLAACEGAEGGQGSRRGGTLLVAAAANLRFAFEEMEPLFEAECGCSVDLTFGSSGNLAEQIEQGLPADVFFSADVAFVDRLESRGLTAAGTKQVYAVGRIVLAKNKGVAADVARLQDLLKPEVRRVSIANPQYAPYGVAAREALTKAGIWEALEPRIVLGENVSQAAQYLETGDVQAGIIPLSLAIQMQDSLTYQLIDESQHARLSQAAAVIKGRREEELARRFLAFVSGPGGREVLSKYGFASPV